MRRACFITVECEQRPQFIAGCNGLIACDCVIEMDPGESDARRRIGLERKATARCLDHRAVTGAPYCERRRSRERVTGLVAQIFESHFVDLRWIPIGANREERT